MKVLPGAGYSRAVGPTSEKSIRIFKPAFSPHFQAAANTP
jgi:hypothetical protein